MALHIHLCFLFLRFVASVALANRQDSRSPDVLLVQNYINAI
jgi:hypothetical protein